jgi:hypothetical protein
MSSIRHTERIAEADAAPLLGSKGDSHDDALTEAIIWLCKAESIHKRALWKAKAAVEFVAIEWRVLANRHRFRKLSAISSLPMPMKTTIGNASKGPFD